MVIKQPASASSSSAALFQYWRSDSDPTPIIDNGATHVDGASPASLCELRPSFFREQSDTDILSICIVIQCSNCWSLTVALRATPNPTTRHRYFENGGDGAGGQAAQSIVPPGPCSSTFSSTKTKQFDAIPGLGNYYTGKRDFDETTLWASGVLRIRRWGIEKLRYLPFSWAVSCFMLIQA